jgi:hypothetical protein
LEKMQARGCFVIDDLKVMFPHFAFIFLLGWRILEPKSFIPHTEHPLYDFFTTCFRCCC